MRNATATNLDPNTKVVSIEALRLARFDKLVAVSVGRAGTRVFRARQKLHALPEGEQVNQAA